MKNILLTAAISALCISGYSQKIKVDQYDKFLKKRRIETNKVNLKQGLSCGTAIGLRAIDTTNFLQFYGYGCGCGVIGATDKFMFLMQDEETIEVVSKGLQSYSINQYNNVFNYEYYITDEQIAKLSDKKAKSIRVYWSSHYNDFDVSASDQSSLMKLFQVFRSAKESPQKTK